MPSRQVAKSVQIIEFEESYILHFYSRRSLFHGILPSLEAATQAPSTLTHPSSTISVARINHSSCITYLFKQSRLLKARVPVWPGSSRDARHKYIMCMSACSGRKSLRLGVASRMQLQVSNIDVINFVQQKPQNH